MGGADAVIRLLALAATAMLLNGCVEIHDRITFKREGWLSRAGSFSLVREARIDRQFYDRLPESQRRDMCPEGEQPIAGGKVKTESEFQGGYFFCRLTVDATELVTSDGNSIFSAVKEDGKIKIRIDPRQFASNMSPPKDEASRDMIRQAFAGRSWRVTLTAPKIYRTSGKLNAGGTEAIWERPMTDIVERSESDWLVFTGEIQDVF
jgi:hypothetical protein